MSEKKPREPMQRRIAYTQIGMCHPLLKENECVQGQYLCMLKSNCSNLFPISKYGNAVLNYYSSIFKVSQKFYHSKYINVKLRIVLLFDILHISGYNFSVISSDLIRSFKFNKDLCSILERLFKKPSYDNKMWDVLIESSYIHSEAEWINYIRKNLAFSKRKPFKVMVTATMSAGKSTFINALVGKKIASTNNLACTGRLHYIYGKPNDDDIISKWDNKVIIDAEHCILNNKEELQDKISYESTYFNGKLKGIQCMILDTPGVNSSEYQKHEKCTQNAIKENYFDALVFLLNYEHIGTDDEIAHLSFVKQNLKESMPIIFCVNKIDSKKKDDLSLEEKFRDIKNYLEEQGFPDASLFFVSSRATYLYRTRKSTNDEDDIEELELLTKKLKRSCNIVELYNTVKPTYINNFEDSFEYQCGISYIEDHIISLINKNERNG